MKKYLVLSYDNCPSEFESENFKELLLAYQNYIGESDNKLMTKAILATDSEREGIDMFNQFINFGTIESIYEIANKWCGDYI